MSNLFRYKKNLVVNDYAKFHTKYFKLLRRQVKIVTKFIIMLVVIQSLFIWSFVNVKAASLTIMTPTSNGKMHVSLSPYFVADIDNVLYPSTSQYFTYDSTQGVGSFKISKPTIVKAFFNWDTTTSTKVSGTAWFSKDVGGLDVIGDSLKLTSPGQSILIFLDPGTYYLHHFINLRASSNGQTSVAKLKFGVALLAEDVKSDEAIYDSSYHFANSLKLNESKRGFLSTTSPIDYYRLRIKEYSRVKITYNFEQTDETNMSKAICTLYDEDNQKITSQRFHLNGEGRNIITQMLMPGTYYLTLSGAMSATNIKVEATSYVVNTDVSTAKWTNQGVVVNVKTEFDTTEALLVVGRVQDNKIQDSSIWRKNKGNCLEIENGKFSVKENGIYSIRVKDENKNYILKRIKISNIDKIYPTVIGVDNGKTYNKSIRIEFTDKGGSDIKLAKLNGKKINSGAVVSKNGKYKLEVYDNAGNLKTLQFTINSKNE